MVISAISFFYKINFLERKSATKWADLHLLQAYLHPPGNLSINALSDFKADNSLVKYSARAVDPLQIDLHLGPIIWLVPAFAVALYPLHHPEVAG